MPLDTRRLGNAALVYVRYLSHGRLEHDEVYCRRDFDTANATGTFDAPAGRSTYIEIQPWHGEDRCSVCEAPEPSGVNDDPFHRWDGPR